MNDISNKIKTIWLLSNNITKKFFLAGVLIGILSAFIEYSFVIIFQSFLKTFDVLSTVDPTAMKLTEFGKNYVIIFLIGIGVLRVLVESSKIFTSRYIQQLFCTFNRKKIIELSLINSDLISSGKAIALFSEEVQRSSCALLNLSSLIINTFSTIILFALCYTIASTETIIAVGVMVLLSIPVFALNKAFAGIGAELSLSWEKTSTTLTDSLRNNFYLKIYGLLQGSILRCHDSLDRYLLLYKKTFKLISLKNTLPPLFGIIAIITIMTARVSFDLMDTNSAKLLSFLYLFLRFTQSLSSVQSLIGEFKINSQALTSIKNTYVQLDNEQNLHNLKDINTHEDYKIDSLEVKDLTFSYSKYQTIIKNLNLSVKQGEILLIKGESGSGKSTLLSLLIGYLNPTSGDILFNNKTIKECFSLLKNKIGYVGPHPFLIEGTIKDNLLYGHSAPELVSSKEISLAIDSAYCSEFINKFEEKELHRLDELGSLLSTGQKQRLMIARALLRKPDILILDEFTANLDSQLEGEILKLINKTKSDKLTIIVSHKDIFNKIADHNIQLEINCEA